MPTTAANQSSSGEPNAIRAFLRRFTLTVTDLAALLDIEPDTLRCYAESGGAPPWLTYALVGVGYRCFGVVALDGTSEEKPRQFPRYLSDGCDRPAVRASQ